MADCNMIESWLGFILPEAHSHSKIYRAPHPLSNPRIEKGLSTDVLISTFQSYIILLWSVPCRSQDSGSCVTSDVSFVLHCSDHWYNWGKHSENASWLSYHLSDLYTENKNEYVGCL